jgi:hypothetical protein
MRRSVWNLTRTIRIFFKAYLRVPSPFSETPLPLEVEGQGEEGKTGIPARRWPKSRQAPGQGIFV